jgi:hypothetical protein
LAKHYFNTHSPVQHQHHIDELDGRTSSTWREMSPLDDALNFLNSICNVIKIIEFKGNPDFKMYDENAARTAVCKPQQQTAEPPPSGANIQVL